MKGEDSLYCKDWFDKAEQDWNRVEILLNAGDAEGAAFHLQQSLEKYLKGFLLSKDWKLQRIHDLEKLLNIAIQYAPELESSRFLCEQVTEYYTSERYPIFNDYIPTVGEIADLKKTSADFVKKLKELGQR